VSATDTTLAEVCLAKGRELQNANGNDSTTRNILFLECMDDHDGLQRFLLASTHNSAEVHGGSGKGSIDMA
jgi:hypothetical protein